MWLPQIPGYPSITLGGAVAANTHGKSSDTHGTIRNQIKSILIFHKTHGWMKLSDRENKDNNGRKSNLCKRCCRKIK